MLMRPEKPASPLKSALLRMTDNFLARINSSSFAAAQRRRALAGLDMKQLADIGLIYVDGDYRPHPEVSAIANNLSCPALGRASTPLVPAEKKGVDGRDKPGHDDGKINGLISP